MRSLWKLPLFLLVFLAFSLTSSCAPALIAPSTKEAIATIIVEKEGSTIPYSTSAPQEAPIGQSTFPSTSFPPVNQAPAPAISQSAQEPSQVNIGKEPLPVEPTAQPSPVFMSSASPKPAKPAPVSTQTAQSEAHIVQVEWPLQMRIGESDIVRLALIPSSQGYDLVTEYLEHQIMTQTITIRRIENYDLFAIARLDGVGFDISPSGEQLQFLSIGERLSWRWSIAPRQPGRQRASINLSLRWAPAPGSGGASREVIAFSRALDVRVLSLFGLTQAQALFAGLITLLFGGGLSVFALAIRPSTPRLASGLNLQPANPLLAIELPAGLRLGENERILLQSLFQRYSRLVIQQEFLSGYSGARTFLALPIRADGRADAYTIAKIGGRSAMQREYQNYETFVKDTLPPITARIQRPPVSTSSSKNARLAALQYTFIGEPGRPPNSLRQTLLSMCDSNLLIRLLDTFGPNWWLQRRPYTFRMATEYDRVLPVHLILEPTPGKGRELDGRLSPADLNVKIGDQVVPHNFPHVELRLDGVSFSLQGPTTPGHAPLRVRWLGAHPPEGAAGKVIATRQSLLHSFIEGFDLFGLPEPLSQIPALLEGALHASQSIIHGDLNLENVLVGPGGMLWLIDFAQTREGHTLFDFAHLGAEIIGQVIAPQVDDPKGFLSILRASSETSRPELASLLVALQEIASHCLYNASQPREFLLAMALSCLGALKFNNLDPHAKHLLYLTAAEYIQLS